MLAGESKRQTGSKRYLKEDRERERDKGGQKLKGKNFLQNRVHPNLETRLTFTTLLQIVSFLTFLSLKIEK